MGIIRKLKETYYKLCLIRKGSKIDIASYLSEGCDIETPVHIGKVLIDHNVKIGKYSWIGSGIIFCNTTIGKYCSISYNVLIGGANHPMKWMSTHGFQCEKHLFKNFKRNIISWDNDVETIIGNDVWIAGSVVIKGGVKIGDGAVIGAGAVITKDVPSYSIVVGNPGKVIGYRFDDEIINKLMEIKWWDLPEEYISDLPFNDIERVIEILYKRRGL